MSKIRQKDRMLKLPHLLDGVRIVALVRKKVRGFMDGSCPRADEGVEFFGVT